jgi:hypothetical protein
MASQQVIEKLEKLQSELDTVSFAVKHIDEAAKVAKTTSDILKKIPELLAELKSVEENHRKDLQKDHKEKIDAIEKQLTELIEKAQQLSQIIDETKKLEKSISDYFQEIKKINFPDRLDKIDNQISSINIGVGNLQTAIQNTQMKIDTVQSSVNEAKHSIEKKQADNQELLIQRQNYQDKEIKLLKTILFIICGLIVIGTVATILILINPASPSLSK